MTGYTYTSYIAEEIDSTPWKSIDYRGYLQNL